jgi:hypothetical protein
MKKQRIMGLGHKFTALVAVPAITAVLMSPAALADDTEAQFTEDIAHWNSLGGQIPGKPSNWLSAAQTVCDGISELQAGGVPPLRAVDTQVRAAVEGGWLKRDGFYLVIHSVNSFCPELRPSS